jgi:hypothetical protein
LRRILHQDWSRAIHVITDAPPFSRLTVEFAELYGKACREARQMAEGQTEESSGFAGGGVGVRQEGGSEACFGLAMESLGAGDAYQTQYFSSNTNKRMRF